MGGKFEANSNANHFNKKLEKERMAYFLRVKFSHFTVVCLSRQHTWRFYTPIAANLIARENRKRFSPPIDADTLGDFFRRSRRCGSFKNSCDEIAQPDGLTLLAICSNDSRKSRERVHLANAGEFNRRYLASRRSAKIAIAPPGTPGDFRRSRRSAYKIAKCVAGLRDTWPLIGSEAWGDFISPAFHM